MFGWAEPTEEQLAELERARMEAEAHRVRFQNFLSEIDEEDLEMLKNIFSHVLNATDPRHVANFYFGVCWGASGVREAFAGVDNELGELLR